MRWDPFGERLVLMFEDSDVLAIFATNVNPDLSMSPLGLLSGGIGESPNCIEFAKKFEEGSLLTVVSCGHHASTNIDDILLHLQAWSSGRFQYVPLLYVPHLGNQSFKSNPIILNAELDLSHGDKPELFSPIPARSKSD